MGWQLGKLFCLQNVGGHGPQTGSAIVSQCSHMAKVYGQPHSLTMKENLVLWETTAAYQ